MDSGERITECPPTSDHHHDPESTHPLPFPTMLSMPQSTQPLNRMIFSLNKFVFSPSCLLCCDEFWPLCHQHLGIGVICWRALLFVRFRPQFRILSEKASWGQTGLRAPLDPSQERPRGTSSYLTCSRPLMMPFAQSRKQRKPLSRIHEFDA